MKNKLFYNLAVYVFLIIVLKEIFTELVPRKIILYNAITLALTFFLTLIAIIYINKKEIKRMFAIYKKNWNVFLKKNLMTWLIGFILMMISNYIIIFLLNNNLSLNEQSVRDIYQNSFLSALFINVFLA
ncbi:MAG: hypothetical protein PHF21_04990, partial [Bacilli bacterium]|nr:hypothetical protein [Bacilli bacterium]